jgi:DNA-binding response OmpR family regulator
VLQILLVDDDATDRELLIDAISMSESSCKIVEASNGEEALAYLNTFNNLPDIIILDLNMPVKDGRETLKDIRASKTFKCIPVCILSTSSAHFDVSTAYEHGATLFLMKPLYYKQLVEMSATLLLLLNKYVKLPGTTLN